MTTVFKYDYKKDLFDLLLEIEVKEEVMKLKLKDNKDLLSDYQSEYSLNSFIEQSKYFRQFDDLKEILAFIKESLSGGRFSFKKEKNSFIFNIYYTGKLNEKETISINITKLEKAEAKQINDIQNAFMATKKDFEQTKKMTEVQLENVKLRDKLKIKNLELKNKIDEIARLKEENTRLTKELEEYKNEVNKNLDLKKSLSQLIEIQKYTLYKQYGETVCPGHDLLEDQFRKSSVNKLKSNSFPNRERVEEPIVPIESPVLPFIFKCGANIRLSEDSLTATKITDNGWNGTVYGNRPLEKRKLNTWKLKITKSAGGGIMIGVVSTDIDPNSNENFRKAKCIYDCDLYFWNLGSTSFYGKEGRIMEGDEVEVIADLTKGTLSFKLNGNNLGVACRDLPNDKDLVPFVEMYHCEKDEVKIITE